MALNLKLGGYQSDIGYAVLGYRWSWTDFRF